MAEDPWSDDMVLKLRIVSVTTSTIDLTGQIPLVVQLSGIVDGPLDNLVPILRAQKDGGERQPTVAVRLVPDDELTPDA